MIARYAKRRDLAEKDIVKALEKIGAVVIRCDDIDLLVGYHGGWFPLEVKTQKNIRKNSATYKKQAELRSRASATGCDIPIVTTVDEALGAIGVSWI